MLATAGYAGSVIGRRTAMTMIMRYALFPLLPTYLKTTHRAKGLLGHLGRTRAGERRSARGAGPVAGGSTLGGVRLTEFWSRMDAQFGEAYAQSVAKDFVFGQLGGRTVERAFADGVDAKVVWRAVCDTFKVPENLR